ncbi:4-hydroxy-tetrahydrodipicolinate synthase [Paenibacillus rigui]|uniref:4-hydroxy-tetrahydrodipicolinate synthase n=1 Tax=Paenibacillus rigui TaxID=554312 RepID=A0A229UWI1_9BACL|nr:4-hydroxy-tetrahydrodipicolinate synthase [Paenibacillus rigui]OXM87896.1 4-hydroxy-tetrahydrodipicolinate synthase [Paenibacillus rigui]
MLTEQQLSGVYVPTITPFDTEGRLDIESFQKHLQSLIASGIDGVVVHGTTGESPTVRSAEIEQLMQAATAAAGPSGLPIVLGTGTNDTASTIKNTERAAVLGAQAVLVVVPYYNRPSQQGIIEHFRQVAQVGIPVIAYEIPYRTGVKLDVNTVRTILELNGVIGLKDCSGSTQLITELSQRGSKPVLCGEDSLMYASLALGAKGIMAAAANVKTDRFVKLYNQFINGNTQEAKETFDELYPLIQLLFAEPNPGPLKWILAQQGMITSSTVRLPLVQITAELQKQLERMI